LVRPFAMFLAIFLLTPPYQSAKAEQAKANFTVGLVIGKPRVRALPPAVAPRKSYTWNAAAISVRLAGFRRPVRLKSGGGIYWFVAEREGRRYRVGVSVSTGAVLKITRAA
jgi:hypothetical protein